jgi:predicted lysophospholipase L1 biosynthesis ABC-type transport system permease subunit
VRNVRLAIRSLLRSSSFTATAVLALGLGIDPMAPLRAE